LDCQRKYRRWQQAITLQPSRSVLFLIIIISIMNYLQETVRDNQLEQHISLGVKVLSADWNRDSRSWDLALSITDENGAKNERRLRCSMLYMCSGYFSYDTPHDPKFPGFDKFKGLTLHPQFWPNPCPPLQGKQVNTRLQRVDGRFIYDHLHLTNTQYHEICSI
jgi:hypothetical protein